MAIYNLGQVAVISRGAWASGTAYAPLNTVTHNGGSFMAIAASTNKEPGVASGWATYWVAMAKGIKTIVIAATDATHAQATVTFSDGTTVTGTEFATNGVADGAVTTAKIATGAVTAVKLGSDILPANVGFKFGTVTPTAGTGANQISPGQVYFKYTAE